MDILCNQFLCCYPISKINWQDVEHLPWDDQLQFLNKTILHPLNKSYPIKKSYQYTFLKTFVKLLEKNAVEIHDTVYEELAALCRSSSDTSSFTYKHYTIPSRRAIITLKESTSFISEGTTGLCSWQASIALSEWLLCNSNIVLGKVVLELGAGTGLSGLIAAKCCQARDVTLTDGSLAVMKLLNENIDLNFLENTTRIRTRLLKWEDESAFSKIDETLPEILLGADITFDSAVFPALINIVGKIFNSTNNSCVFYLAATIRNEATFNQFAKLIDEYKFKMLEQVYIPPSSELFWDESTPIRIYSITR